MAPRLTIILPLKGRHLFTFRFLWHANKARLPYRFLIADGQVSEAVARRLEDSRKDFPELDIEYIRYPDDVDYSRYFAKISDAVQRVRTPYVMRADNDDFLGFSGIERALDFLDANEDFVCARARNVNLTVRSGIGDFYGAIYGEFNHFSMYSDVKDVVAPTATERLRQGGLCHGLYYAIFRTAAPVKISREIAEIGFSDLMLYEDFYALRALTLGNVHTDRGTVSYYSQGGTGMSYQPMRDWAHHLLRSGFTSDAHALVDRISSAVVEADGAEATAIAETVRTILEYRYSTFLSVNYGAAAQLKRALRRKWPRVARYAQTRPRLFVGRERARLLAELKEAGADEQDLRRVRGELAEIGSALSQQTFADYAAPFLPLPAADDGREWL